MKLLSSLVVVLLLGNPAAFSQTVTGTGTVNYVPKFTGTSVIGNSTIYDNGTNVGIGTILPQSKLHLNGSGTTPTAPILILQNSIATGLVGSLRFASGYNSFDNWSGIEAYSAGGLDQQDLRFYTTYNSRNERMRITLNGHVGIGTTTPGAPLQVGSSTSRGFRVYGNTGPNGTSLIGDAGGWAVGYYFEGNAGTALGGFGAYGNSDVLSNYFIGGYTNQKVSILSNGNVGIGTSPSVKLDVVGLGANNIDFQTTGRMAIKGSSPGVSFNDGTQEKSFIGWMGSGNAAQALGIYTPTADTRGGWNTFNVMGNGSIALGAQTANTNAKLDVTGDVFANGKVLIGFSGLTATDYTNKIGTYSLAVNGDGIFNKVKVKLYPNWPDYVFENGYGLPTLESLEKFIKVNKHLPGLPTSKEVDREGIDLGNNQIILLQKIEELTLYTIDQNKRSLILEEKYNNLLKELEVIKSQLKSK